MTIAVAERRTGARAGVITEQREVIEIDEIRVINRAHALEVLRLLMMDDSEELCGFLNALSKLFAAERLMRKHINIESYTSSDNKDGRLPTW